MGGWEKGIKTVLRLLQGYKTSNFFWQFRGDDHLFWQLCEGFLMTFSNGSFVRHLNLINTIVSFLTHVLFSERL